MPAIIGIYIAFQVVVLAALRQRLKGWRPAGPFSLGMEGYVINIAALTWGVFAIILLAVSGSPRNFAADWIVLLGLGVMLGVSLLYLLIARPDRESDAPSGDAIEVAEKLRAHGAKERM